jgi:hypothetical protein
MSSLRKVYSRYNVHICNYKLSLICFRAFIRLRLLYWLWWCVTPCTQFSLGANGGCGRSAEDAYSWVAPDPTFTFVGDPCCPTIDLYLIFGLPSHLSGIHVGLQSICIWFLDYLRICRGSMLPYTRFCIWFLDYAYVTLLFDIVILVN